MPATRYLAPLPKLLLRCSEKRRFWDNVAARSKQLFGFLHDLKSSGTKGGALIEDVRGRGLMVGVQFVTATTQSSSSNTAATDAQPAPMIGPKVVQECLKRNMLLLSTSVFDVLRLHPTTDYY